MERNDIESALSEYNLPSDMLWEMRRVLEKRCRAPFSAGLSPEGRLAMQQVVEEDQGSQGPQTHRGTDSIMSRKSKHKLKHKGRAKSQRNISFSDTYRKSSTVRLEGDITDEEFVTGRNGPMVDANGKGEAAQETVETVTQGVATDAVVGVGGGGPDNDTAAIEETAKRNSVEKCLVWMEVNTTVSPSNPASARSAVSVV